jgi:plasmid stability protein
MPTLSIKDVPEEVAEALRQRARRHHRSLQGELMALVVEAAALATGDSALSRPASRPLSLSGALPQPGLKAIEQIAREHLARHPKPVRAGPSASRRLRAERDST